MDRLHRAIIYMVLFTVLLQILAGCTDSQPPELNPKEIASLQDELARIRERVAALEAEMDNLSHAALPESLFDVQVDKAMRIDELEQRKRRLFDR